LNDSHFLDYVADGAEHRVLVMARLFKDNHELFCEAHGELSFEPDVSDEEEALGVLEHCCKIVAPDWTWTISVEGEDVTVAVKAFE